MPREPITPEEVEAELRRDFARHPELDATGVDIAKVAREVTDLARRVPGWEAPRVLTGGWYEPLTVQRGPDGTTVYQHHALRLKALLSCNLEPGYDRAWLHLSVSHQTRIPTWSELGEAKRAFLGDREAYQVLPPASRYVNINPKVLHLWALLDENAPAPLPDFTRGTGAL